MNGAQPRLTDIDVAAFRYDGYIVVRSLADAELCRRMRDVAARHLLDGLAPVEYEVDVQYPGAPREWASEGGLTVRRLLNACSRDALFLDWATGPDVGRYLGQLFGGGDILLSQCHHNCIMTKQPGYSSATMWHQDNRYWSFDHRNLISVWLALGDETRSNGCLRVLPGSHLLDMEPGCFDAALFLRTDLAENKRLVATARTVELTCGDVLFFHSRLFHAASRNRTADVKYSAVFTYHEASNRPIDETRSARFSSIPVLPAPDVF